MDIATSKDPVHHDGSGQAHNLLLGERHLRGWGRDRLASELERVAAEQGLRAPERAALLKAIYRHETGRVAVRDKLYIRLYCLVFGLSRTELVGSDSPEEQLTTTDRIHLVSHKFAPVHVGPDEVGGLVAHFGLRPATMLGFECHIGPIKHETMTGQMVAFPWGVAVLQVREPVVIPDLSTLAAWRRRTNKAVKSYVAQAMSVPLGRSATAPYVLSAYWVDRPVWAGPALDSAIRLLSMPRVLLGRRTPGTEEVSVLHATELERRLLREGFDDDQIVSFGIHGLSIGCASWAGVSYCPLSPSHALQPEHLIEMESVVQALWTHCHSLRKEIEKGVDPPAPAEYDWRWLRGARSRLTAPRENEGIHHAALRSALITTSRLDQDLDHAIDILRDLARS